MKRRNALVTGLGAVAAAVTSPAAAVAGERVYVEWRYASWGPLVEDILRLEGRHVYSVDVVRKPIETSETLFIVKHTVGVLEASVDMACLKSSVGEMPSLIAGLVRTRSGRARIAASLCSEPTFPGDGGLDVNDMDIALDWEPYVELAKEGRRFLGGKRSPEGPPALDPDLERILTEFLV